MSILNSEGGCSCGYVRYREISEPCVVHCCHCSVCQRQTGSAFVINALFWAEHVELIQGEVVEFLAPSPSGKGQKIARCPKCSVAVWSNYYMGGIKDGIRFIRVGTMDNPNLLPPDVHIFTTTKQDWVVLPKAATAVDVFYDYEDVWSKVNLQRRNELLNQILE
ncbi:MAG: aldehyde-activating protein [Gammaproteobacteria bacterium]|nr:MAG: aldehyde-activating protein [Gammaproteobacteria bacterium]